MKKTLFCSWTVLIVLGLSAAICGALRGYDSPLVSTETYCLSKTVYLTNDRTDSLKLAFQYDYPLALPTADSAAHAIRADIQAQLFGEAFRSMRPELVLEAYAALRHTEYLQNNLPLMLEWDANPRAQKDDHGAMFCEDYAFVSGVYGLSHHILSYGEECYAYTGGAHGNSYTLIFNYSLLTGAPIHEEDIFVDDYFEPLHHLLVEALIYQTENADTERALRKLGFSVEDIVPNDNFYVTEDGFVFVFNPYDIAPYAMGRIDIFLSYDKIDKYLR